MSDERRSGAERREQTADAETTGGAGTAAGDGKKAGDGATATDGPTADEGVRTWPVIGLALAALWLFVRGVHPDPRTVAGEFVIGLFVGVPLAFVLRQFYEDRVNLGRLPQAAPYAVLYLAVFLRELLTANVDVAYRVLHPRLPIKPAVVEVPLRVETDLAITTIANSITLTPGTLTMDHDPERNSLYVHAIAAHDRGSVVRVIRTWEDYALLIFDERLSPSDPVPTGDRPHDVGPGDAVEFEGGDDGGD